MIDEDHPEGLCTDCGRRNVCWSVDSDRWNFVARTGDVEPMLCPACFVIRWEKVTGMVACWTLVPDVMRWP